MDNTFRLGIIFTHPTQHHAPLWQKLNEQAGVEVTALYLCTENQMSGDRQLGVSEAWDIDLTSGYQYKYLKTITGKVAPKIRKDLFHPELVAQLTPQNFDAVFLSSFYTYSYRLAILLCKLRGIPIIMQNDATIISDGKYSRTRQLALAALYPWMYSLTDYWISSGDHNEIYLRHYGVSENKIVRGCYPVDRDRFEQTAATHQDEIQRIRQELSWNDDTILYCFVGKYIERKNPFEFIEAIVKAHQIDPRVRGIMIGGGILKTAIQHRLDQLNGEVLDIGFVNQSKLPLYYAAMSAFISTSQFDPHPLVVSEAMAMGCPPILSDRCGNWGYSDTVQHRYNGLVYPYGKLDKLVEAILALTETKARQEYSQRSQEIFAGQDLNFEVKAFLEVIDRIQCSRQPNPTVLETALPQPSEKPVIVKP